jgi:hypothetical protein
MEAQSGAVPMESRRFEANHQARRTDRGGKSSSRGSRSAESAPLAAAGSARDLYRIVLGCAYAGARGPASEWIPRQAP